MLTVVTGGARSGKSCYALNLASRFEAKLFVATAEPLDAEMQQRIETHRRERDPSFFTLEEPLDLADAVAGAVPGTEVIVVDCLTLWLSNLMHHVAPGADWDQPAAYPQIGAFLRVLEDGLEPDLVLVTNEVGMGLVPMEPMGRAFRDLAGSVNQAVARRADRLVLMVSGVPFESCP